MHAEELDDLRTAWQTLDARLSRQTDLAHTLFREDRLRRARSHLWPLAAGQVVQVAIGLMAVPWLAQYWVHHVHSPVLFVSALLLHVYFVAMMVTASFSLLVLLRLKYAQPVLVVQRSLATLHAWRLREARWFAYAGAVVWVPMVLVAFDAWFGIDVAARSSATVAMFGLSAAVCAGIVASFYRWRNASPARRAGIERETVGGSLARARAAVAEIDGFRDGEV